jgi:hypothetical protein
MIAPDTHELNAEITALLDAPAGGDGAPTLRHLEDTLTTGYAQALWLEAQRERIERSLVDTAPAEQAELRTRLEQTEDDLAALRRLLNPLRSRARAVRALNL